MEKFFWADKLAKDIIKVNKDKKIYVVASGITPSGQIHIGNFREVITTDMVARALESKGKKVRFIYSWDDFDRFRKVPKGVPKEYEKYIGMPLSEIPSPSGKGSYAEYLEKEFEDSLKKIGISPEFIRQSVMYKKCAYAKLIKKAIDSRKDIIKILNKYRKEPLNKDWYPIEVYCEKCKKDSTKVKSVESYEVEYECKCGFKNKFDIRKKGIVKARWRVDWPMRWKYEEVDFEPGGIDHSVAGSSYFTGKEIVKKVYNHDAPMYQLYEWIGIKGGGAFSSSAGNVLTLNDVEEIYEPEVLRYLFVGTKPKSAFSISFDNDVIKIYEDFDALERKYYDGSANPREKRMYEMSKLDKSKKQPKRISFRHLITLVQVGKTKDLNGLGKKRAEKARNWLEKYAGKDMKFKVQDKVKIKLSGKDKDAMLELKKSLERQNYTEDELFNEFYNVCEKAGTKNTDFFRIAYLIIIGKGKGPRLASLILAIGKEKVIKLLKQIK
ncbi:lysine--tRNA ligase [Candidatus Pacearchaeota archaeon]|nr:lysine--tRNA ligase [Candidatus Pacearchaeota archaeon]